MLSDFRFAARQLAKSPGFTAVAVIALALGVATSTTMFTFYRSSPTNRRCSRSRLTT
jgi:hypothetical protein